MSIQKIRDTYACRLEALTPLHVGSGESMKNGFDFFVVKGKIHLVSASRLMAEIENLGADKIEDFTRAIDEHETEQWIKRHGLRIEKFSLASFPLPPGGKNPNEIRAHIKDGFGRPYLPGSSIKGSLRTAIIRKLARETDTKIEPGSNNPKLADQKICKELLGNDAKISLMRSLSVGDFVIESKEMVLHMVWVNRLISATNFAGKFPIFIEGTTSKTTASGTISVDRFLSAADQVKNCFNFKTYLDLPWLIAACRELTDHTIATELAFFKGKSGKPVQGIIGFYDQLREQQRQLEDNEVIIQMAWGTGWRGMTGQLLETENLTKQIRKDLRLASQKKYLDSPFPKSRRIVTVNGLNLPMGWARISFLSKEELRQKEEEERQQAIIRQREKEKERAEKAIANAAQELENFKQRVSSCSNLPGEIDSFIQQIQQKDSEETRIEMCRSLLEKGNSLGKKKNFSKALKNSKKWAIRLKEICEENGIEV